MAMRSVLPMTRVQRYHGSASVIERERKGQSTWFSVGDLPFSRIAGSRVFTPSELYEVYRLCPDIRAPIDLISLRVAQTPWVVAPKANLKKGTRQWLKARALAAQVTHWLSKPNAEETWHAFAQKWAHDALVFDASAVEHARTPKGQLEELVEWRGGDFTPLQDEHGRVYRYRQDMSVGGPVYFLPEDLTYTNIFVNTTYPDGQPRQARPRPRLPPAVEAGSPPRRVQHATSQNARNPQAPAPIAGGGLNVCPRCHGRNIFKAIRAPEGATLALGLSIAGGAPSCALTASGPSRPVSTTGSPPLRSPDQVRVQTPPRGGEGAG